MRIIGHRGARGEAPENTLGGFRYLHNLGIRAVEFDVRQLHDDSLIIIHDDQMIRTTGQSQALYDCDREQLKYYNHAEHWKDWPDFEATPLLSDTLRIIHDFNHIEVEVKTVPDELSAHRIVQHLQTALFGFEETAIITSFDLKIHQALNEQRSSFKKGLLIETDLKQLAIEQALSLGCSQIGWMNQLATNEIISATHAANLNVSVWTVNDPERAKQLSHLGVEGLITDFPKLMLSHLRDQT